MAVCKASRRQLGAPSQSGRLKHARRSKWLDERSMSRQLPWRGCMPTQAPLPLSVSVGAPVFEAPQSSCCRNGCLDGFDSVGCYGHFVRSCGTGGKNANGQVVDLRHLQNFYPNTDPNPRSSTGVETERPRPGCLPQLARAPSSRHFASGSRRRDKA